MARSQSLRARDVREAQSPADLVEAAILAVSPDDDLTHPLGNPVEGRQHGRFLLVADRLSTRRSGIPGDRLGLARRRAGRVEGELARDPPFTGLPIATDRVRDPVQQHLTQPRSELGLCPPFELREMPMGLEEGILHQVRCTFLDFQLRRQLSLGDHEQELPKRLDRPAQGIAIASPSGLELTMEVVSR